MDGIVFDPIYQTRVWGGRMLESRFGRQLPDEQPYGESWEISGRPEAESRVAKGEFEGKSINELWRGDRKVEIFGTDAPFGESENFPLLCKILDARERLSIQVHPPADIAEELGGEPKTEMWYVAAAVPGAELYIGLKAGVSRENFESALEDGSVENLVHRVPVKTGDYIFIPSGRLHAIGSGIVIYEIQENSDTTYRVFDWNRLGIDGEPRELHVEESLQCIDFDDIEPGLDTASGTVLAECPQFRVELQNLLGAGIDLYLPPNQFAIVTVVDGMVRFREDQFLSGDFFIVPAESSELKALEASVPAKVLMTSWPKSAGR